MKTLFLFLVLGVLSSTCYGSGGGVGGSSSDHDGEEDIPDTEGIKQAFIGKWFKMDCQSLNSTSGLHWYRNGTEISSLDERFVIYQDNATLLIRNANEGDVTTFKCEDKETKRFREIEVYVLSFKRQPKSTTVQEDDKLSLICDAHGKPDPVVQWVKDDVPIMKALNDTSRVLLSANEKGIKNATLKIIEINHEDRGKYSCLVYLFNSDVPVRNSTTLVRVRSIYAALWPFLGIVAEVAILCLVIFIYERKRMKAEYDESDTDQGQDQSNS